MSPLEALKEACRDFIADHEGDAMSRLSDALDRYWVSDAPSDLEPIDPDESTRRAVAEAIDWDRAFNREPTP